MKEQDKDDFYLLQSSGAKRSITPDSIKGNIPIENRDQDFKQKVKDIISESYFNKLPDNCLVISKYGYGGSNLATRLGINKNLTALIREKKFKTKNKELLKEYLLELEELLMQDAIALLEKTTSSSAVAIDIFERRIDVSDSTKYIISLSELDTHTVVLWKYINAADNPKIVVIDPNRGSYSTPIYSKIEKLTTSKYEIKALLPDENIIFYSTRGLTPGYTDYNQEQHLPRNCIDLAIKIIFCLNNLMQEERCSFEYIKFALLDLSNQFYFFDYGYLFNNTPLREIQSSSPEMREATRQIIDSILHSKIAKFMPTLVDQSVQQIQNIHSDTSTTYRFDQCQDVINIDGKLVSSKIPVIPPVCVTRHYSDESRMVDQIHNALYQQDKDYVLIEAKSGVGKTMLILEYIKLFQEQGQQIKWFNAFTDHVLKTEYHDMARQLGIDTRDVGLHTIASLISAKLSGQHLLFVYDNVDNSKLLANCIQKLPQSVKIIMIARQYPHTQYIETKNGAKFTLEEFSHNETEEYLSKALPIRQFVNQDQNAYDYTKLIQKLVDVLGTYPLKLQLSVMYINNNPRLGINDILKYFDKNSNAIFQKILDSIKKDSISWKILEHIVYLDPDFIDLDIVKAISTKYAQFDELDFFMVMKSLENTGLVTRIEEGQYVGYSISQLVQEEVISYINNNTNKNLFIGQENIFNYLTQILSKLMPSVSYVPDANWDKASYLLYSVVKILEMGIAESGIDTICLLNKLGRYYYNILNDYNKAVGCWIQELMIIKQIKIDDDLLIARSTHDIGRAMHALGKIQNGLEYKTEALNIRQNNCDSPLLVAHSLLSIGESHYELQQLKPALEKYFQALKIFQNLRDDQYNSNIATLYNNIGMIYDHLGKFSEARKYKLDALQLHEAIGNQSDVAITLDSIGSSLELIGKYEEALKYRLDAFNKREHLYSNFHPTIAESLNNIGATKHMLGELREALKCQLDALQVRNALSQDDHPSTAAILDNMGATYDALGSLQEGLRYRVQALDMYKRIYPDNHYKIAFVMDNVGDSYKALNLLDKSLEYYNLALKIRQNLYGTNRHDIALSFSKMAILYQAKKELASARHYANLALEMIKKCYDHDHPDIVNYLSILGSIDLECGYTDAGSKELYAALQMHDKIFKGPHAQKAIILDYFGQLYDTFKQPTLALEQKIKALQVLQKLYKGNHYKIILSLYNIAKNYCELQDYITSIKYYDDALDMIWNSKLLQYQLMVQNGLKYSVSLFARSKNLNLKAIEQICDLCLTENIKFFDCKYQLETAKKFSKAQEFTVVDTIKQIVVMYISQFADIIAIAEKQIIVIQLAKLNNLLSDQINERHSSYIQDADRHFQEGLTLESNNIQLCIEYADFLMMHSRFQDAWHYLQNVITSQDDIACYEYSRFEQQIRVHQLRYVLGDNYSDDIKICAIKYAYYLIIQYYKEFEKTVQHVDTKELYQTILDTIDCSCSSNAIADSLLIAATHDD